MGNYSSRYPTSTGAANPPLTVKDEGSTLSSSVTSVDFVGAGVTATNSGNAVTVTIPASTAYPTYTIESNTSGGVSLSSSQYYTQFIGTFTANRTVTLPASVPQAGSIYVFSRPDTAAFDLIFQASGGQTLTASSSRFDPTIRNGYVVLVALSSTPTTAASWWCEEVEEVYVDGSQSWTGGVFSTNNATVAFNSYSRTNNKVAAFWGNGSGIVSVTAAAGSSFTSGSYVIPSRLRPTNDVSTAFAPYLSSSAQNAGNRLQITASSGVIQGFASYSTGGQNGFLNISVSWYV